MKKTINVVLLLLTIMFQSVSADVLNIYYDGTNADRVIIEGDTDFGENGTVLLSIFKGDENYSTLEAEFNDESDKLIYIGTSKTDADGHFVFNWVPKNGTVYDFYASCEGKLLTEKPFSKFLMNGMSSVYNQIKSGDAESIREVFADDLKRKAIIGDNALYEKIKTPQKAADNLLLLKNGFGLKENITDYISLSAAFAALDESGEAYCLDVLVDNCKKLNYELDNLDLYENNASADIKKEMAAGFLGCSVLTQSQFNKKFTDELITAGVYKCGNYTDAIPFLDALNNSSYEKSKMAAAREVCGKKYTVEELNKKLDELSGTSGGKSGGSTGGSSGGGISVAYSPLYDNIKNEPQTNNIINNEPKNDSVFFNDVGKNHWAYDFINKLRWKDIVCGDENGNFYPDENITRAECVKMLCVAFGVDFEGSYPDMFDDVPREKWYFNYISSASAKSLVNGTGEKMFSPEDDITRQDMTVMVYRFALNAGYLFDTNMEISYADADKIAEYAAETVSKLSVAGIINGMGDNKFMPQENATRAQMAAIITKATEYKREI